MKAGLDLQTEGKIARQAEYLLGISSTPEIFQRLMTDILQGKPGANFIMDDILVDGKIMEEHESNLERVLDAVQLSGLKLNKLKCEFRKQEIGYFGHRVGKDGILYPILRKSRQLWS